MKSFQSAPLKGGTNLNPVNANSSAKDQLINSFTNAMNSTMSSMTSGNNLDTEGLDVLSQFDYRESLDNFDFTKKEEQVRIGNVSLFPNNAGSGIENVYRIGAEVFNKMNNYRGYLQNVTVIEDVVESTTGTGDKSKAAYGSKVIQFQKITPSLFNPMYGLISNSITDNVPLLDNISGDELDAMNIEIAKDLSDCSIKTLVEGSRGDNYSDTGKTYNSTEELKTNGGNSYQTDKDGKNVTQIVQKKIYNSKNVLGNAKYKYADFMYCKHLGQVSNNHLITLRRYPFPIGDDINQLVAKEDDFQPDIARLVTWFGTEDNKLESIMSYDVEASWKELNAEHEEQQSQESDPARGGIGQFANLMSTSFQKQMLNGVASLPFIDKFMGRYGGAPAYAGNPAMTGQRYDKNKIYDPINTMRSTHKYEGVLKFNHEFSLKFSYKLRAYDNINPKSAFLDLLGNILVMTYRNGNFWGGSRSVYGPTTNRSVWNSAEDMIGTLQNGILDAFKTLWDGGLNLDALFGAKDKLLQAGKEAFGKGKEWVEKQGGISEVLKTAGMGFLSGIMGSAHNKLGRPAVYAFSSMLDGSNVGLWHVTIGNPKNPIASFGNLILTKAKITHSGPLGIDDFPTELTVEVSLKHARPRDASEIQRMYTRGMRQIYYAYSTLTNVLGSEKPDPETSINSEVAAQNLVMTSDYFNAGPFQKGSDRLKVIRNQLL